MIEGDSTREGETKEGKWKRERERETCVMSRCTLEMRYGGLWNMRADPYQRLAKTLPRLDATAPGVHRRQLR